MKKLVLLLVIPFLVVVVGVVGMGGYLYYSLQRTVSAEMQEGLERYQSPHRYGEVQEGDPLSLLFIGVDAEDGEAGRSDTMIVVTLNPDKGSYYMVSIPRDTRTDIVGHGTVDKLNHAYAFGREEMTAASVEHFLDIPIDHVLSVNMTGFQEMIDLVGGVTVQNEIDFQYNEHVFRTGEMHLDGEQALAYTRMRSEDPRGDLGRNDRQQLVIQGLLQEAASLQSITKIPGFLDIAGDHIRTNMDMGDVTTLFQHYRPALETKEQLAIEGTGDTIDGVWYFIVDEAEQERISSELKRHLDL
ncbi:LCP family protein [Alkalicoccus luteus]|uniref:LytR family transcriptional regulator n=1 Tax=Alkalicoccus luteus TaxID=1237094 RepID=A0A969PQ55_9BACI|nr:LCP family protein [Alkalicoccus luteus]NJP38351.1 LytR family transcriptional regulator [Alkalicoccus luteus]